VKDQKPKPQWCCQMMEYHATYTCDVHDRFECPDIVMHRYVNTDGRVWYGIPIHDGGTSAIKVAFCPWCSFRLTPDVDDAAV
jgi:hypothetical protein